MCCSPLEMVGAVNGIDPETGHAFDDTKRYIEAAAIADADRARIYAGNALRVYPRLGARLASVGRRRRGKHPPPRRHEVPAMSCEPVTLTGRHVELVPLAPAHAPALAEAVRDGDLWRLWYTAIPAPEAMAGEIARRLGLQAAGSMLPFAVLDGPGERPWA